MAPDPHTRPMTDLLLAEGATIKAKEAGNFAFLISDLGRRHPRWHPPRLDVAASLADAAGTYTTEGDLVCGVGFYY